MDSAKRQRIDLLGAPLDPCSTHESVDALFALVAQGGDRRTRHVVTLNPEYVMAVRRDRTFARAIGNADLILADGAGIAVAARLLGGEAGRRVGRLTGVETVEQLAEAGTPIFFLGAAPGVASAAARKLAARFPNASIMGVWADGTPDPRHDAEAIRRIAESGAEVVAVAYGSPGQIFWIERNRAALGESGVRMAVGVGGAFDYLSGMSARPPALVRRCGLEWLWRLAREPRRWRRQLVLRAFAFSVLVDWARRRMKAHSR